MGRRTGLLLLALIVLCAASPAGAAILARDVRVDPAGDVMMPGTSVAVDALACVVPSGPTTFPDSHTFSLATGLDDPHWDVAVTVDGRTAAVFTRTGPRVFVSGFLLSYPATRDVGVQVGLRGTVPGNPPGGAVTLLEWLEIDGQGNPVPGSRFSVERSTGETPAGETVTPTATAPLPGTPGETGGPPRAKPAFPLLALALALSLLAGRGGGFRDRGG